MTIHQPVKLADHKFDHQNFKKIHSNLFFYTRQRYKKLLPQKKENLNEGFFIKCTCWVHKRVNLQFSRYNYYVISQKYF